VKILIIGASKGTGALAVEAALARGHQVTAFARSPQNLKLEHGGLTRFKGNFHDPASVEAAVKGHDAVIITAAPTTLKALRESPTFFSLGTGYVIEAMKKHGSRRLVVLSALGVGDSRPLFNWLMQKLIIDWVLKTPYRDHDVQEQQARNSGLDWVIARPSRLTNGPARKRYVKQPALEKVPGSISRADVADFLVEAAEQDTWLHKAVQLGG